MSNRQSAPTWREGVTAAFDRFVETLSDASARRLTTKSAAWAGGTLLLIRGNGDDVVILLNCCALSHRRKAYLPGTPMLDYRVHRGQLAEELTNLAHRLRTGLLVAQPQGSRQ